MSHHYSTSFPFTPAGQVGFDQDRDMSRIRRKKAYGVCDEISVSWSESRGRGMDLDIEFATIALTGKKQ